MSRPLPAVAAVAIAAAALAATSPLAAAPAAASCSMPRLPRATPAGQTVLWGHVESIAPKGRRFELRFDPALFLGGTTANRAAIDDKVIPPGDVVPNDYYVRDESHRLLTFVLPATARATVVTHGARGFCATTVGIAELAQIVAGRNPRHRRLYVPGNQLGFWIRVAVDTVRSLDQQYQP